MANKSAGCGRKSGYGVHMIFRNRLLAACGDEALRELQPHFHEMSLAVGRILFEAETSIEHVYFPSSGVVSVVTLMRSGESVESLTVGREGALGLVCSLGDRVSDVRAIVQIAGSAWRISAERVRTAAHAHPIITDVALRYAQTTISPLHRSAACNALHSM